MPETGRGRDAERFLTFLDAIAAIAITLLVLPLVELAGDLGDDLTVRELVGEHRAQVFAFLLSFVVVAELWWSQHRTVRRLVRLTTGLFWLLMAWALTIVFLPFATALVAERPGESLTKVLYIGTTALSMLVLAAVAALLERDRSLVDGEPGTRSLALLVNAGLLGVALAITLAFPATSYFPMFLLALDNLVARALRRTPRKA